MKKPVQFKDFDEYSRVFAEVVSRFVGASPLLKKKCLIHGSGAASVLHLGHRMSWDLDLMSKDLLGTNTDVIQQLRKNLGGRFELHDGDHDSQMYQGVYFPEDLPPIDVQIFPNVFDWIEVSSSPEKKFGGIEAATLPMYIEEKVASSMERRLSKDIHDLACCMADQDHARTTKQIIVSAGKAGALRLRHAADKYDHTAVGVQPSGFKPASLDDIGALRAFAENRIQKYKLIERNAAQYDFR